jgi:hypothetical protein
MDTAGLPMDAIVPRVKCLMLKCKSPLALLLESLFQHHSLLIHGIGDHSQVSVLKIIIIMVLCLQQTVPRQSQKASIATFKLFTHTVPVVMY